MSSVAIIDYGMGNLHSIKKALQHASPEIEVKITADETLITQADRVVFPGVGAIRDCMQALDNSGLSTVIKEVAKNQPLLAICVGMQALLSTSEENNKTVCLGVFLGQVKRFSLELADANDRRLKIPHMGWNQVRQKPHPLWAGIPQNSRFYFLHSYYAEPSNVLDTVASTEYPNAFASALAKDNVFAVQFHPEKSQLMGLQLLKNFLSWNGNC